MTIDTCKKKTIPTPPAPQNTLRRMKFFVEHQDDPNFPNARHEAMRMSVKMALNAKSNRRRIIMTPPKAETSPHKPENQKKPFLERIFSKFKKANQRGN